MPQVQGSRFVALTKSRSKIYALHDPGKANAPGDSRVVARGLLHGFGVPAKAPTFGSAGHLHIKLMVLLILRAANSQLNKENEGRVSEWIALLTKAVVRADMIRESCSAGISRVVDRLRQATNHSRRSIVRCRDRSPYPVVEQQIDVEWTLEICAVSRERSSHALCYGEKRTELTPVSHVSCTPLLSLERSVRWEWEASTVIQKVSRLSCPLTAAVYPLFFVFLQLSRDARLSLVLVDHRLSFLSLPGGLHIAISPSPQVQSPSPSPPSKTTYLWAGLAHPLPERWIQVLLPSQVLLFLAHKSRRCRWGRGHDRCRPTSCLGHGDSLP